MSEPSHIETKSLDITDHLRAKVPARCEDNSASPENDLELSHEAQATLALTYATLAVVEQLRRLREQLPPPAGSSS
jgi:hypothetical protein